MEHFSLFGDFDISLFRAGKHFRMYEKLGAHICNNEDQTGTYFAVWAPNARYVSVVGNFNGWNRESHPMKVRWDESGIWEVFIPGLQKGDYYKYYIVSNSGYSVEKMDPYGYHCETPPQTASIIWDLDYMWEDEQWLNKRNSSQPIANPISIYEVHLGSWRRKAEEGERFLTYRELAEDLPTYCRYMGFTHVEFLPVMEHPFYGSWGYQITGYFAPSSRYGVPQDFMFLIDKLHQAGVGVILDWVPSHFATDGFGLTYFDGTHLYEHPDPQKGFHEDWKSYIFNYGRNEVRAFLISNALYWLDKYHIDGLRVDAVASMLYLDYSRKEGQWTPNQYGGRENLDAISLLREFNEAIHTHHPGTISIAEESTAWPGVTASSQFGGLGFDLKWMMGWMHDTLGYFKKDPIHRSFQHNQITFSIFYAFSEKYLLPLSHDEVVYGKGSLINKMPGDEWQQFANLRLLIAYMYGHPGAKLLFMGGEFGQRREWRHDHSLDWHENEAAFNRGLQHLVKDLNSLYQQEPSLYERDFDWQGFEWIDLNDYLNSVLTWQRKAKDESNRIIFVANFTPLVRENYRIGVPAAGEYTELLNSDAALYGGSNCVSEAGITSEAIPMHGHPQSLVLRLPPLGISILKRKDISVSRSEKTPENVLKDTRKGAKKHK